MYDLDYESPYEPGEHWFSVEKSEPGDPMLNSLTVGGRAISIFNRWCWTMKSIPN